MALDKLVDSTALDNGLTTVADAIRTKGGTTAQLAFPNGMAQAIEDLPSGDPIEIAFEDTNETLIVGKALSISYVSDNDGYVSNNNYRKSTQSRFNDSTKVYMVKSNARFQQIACWGFMPSAETAMENHSTLVGGVNVDPTAKNYTDSGWQSNNLMFAPMYGAKFIKLQSQSGVNSGIPSKVYSAKITEIAALLLSKGYVVDRIIYPNEIKRANLTNTTPFYVYADRDVYSTPIEMMADYDYCVANPNGYPMAIHLLTAAGKTAYDNGQSIANKYTDSGWQKSGYEFSPSAGSWLRILMDSKPSNNTSIPMNAGCFIVVGRRLKSFDPDAPDTTALSIGHRGYTGDGARENTLDAAKAAALHGFDITEMDVQSSADGVLFCNHNDTYAGLRIETTSSADLIAAGCEKFETILAWCAQHNYSIMPEIKDNKTSTAHLVAQLVADYNFLDNTYFQAATSAVLEQLHTDIGENRYIVYLTTAYTKSTQDIEAIKTIHEKIILFAQYSANYYEACISNCDFANVLSAFWTVDNASEIFNLENAGVWGVCSNTLTVSEAMEQVNSQATYRVI